MPLVASLRGVSKSFGGVRALSDVNLEVLEGEVVGVIGANGAGKTTLMTILQGCQRPDKGDALVFGHRATALGPLERGRLGAQLDRGGLPPNLRVLEVLKLFRRLYGHGLDPLRLLEELGLARSSSQLLRDLSTGQYRRLAVAAALIGQPRLVFLDEPSLGLDPGGRRVLCDVLLDASKRGSTFLLTTNAMEEAETLCTRVAFLRAGRIAETGSPRELTERYALPCLEEVFHRLQERVS